MERTDKQEKMDTEDVYRHAVRALAEARVPFLVGGTFALEFYTGIARRTKDLDFFVKPSDGIRALNVLDSAGYRTEMKFPHWLARRFEDMTSSMSFSVPETASARSMICGSRMPWMLRFSDCGSGLFRSKR
ncbi:MAG: hypothetical protein C4293_20720 [Nitrospiraceae bacterium]